MSDKIRLLPDVVANQIAAGEVVNNPSSVVKEMMENAVDAGASSVTVNYREGGTQLIQVVDDGAGMSPADARMAFERHATSKIRQAEDIYSIATFGFRGEALASIAAVAEVEVRTRQRGEDFGTSVEIGGGTFRSQNVVSCPEGTQFFVKNLFYNIPARRRFIESAARESRRIREEFRRVALCHPGVAFALYENDAPLYNLPASNLRTRIVGAIGRNIASNLLEVGTETSIARIEGFVGRPAASKQNNSEQYLFVNGRYFKSGYFQKAIFQAYEKLIPSNTKPSYFLYLTIDPERIDVNVHPQKTEVKFEDGAALWQIIHAAVREGLAKTGALPMMDFDMDTSIQIPVHREGIAYKSPEIKPNPDFNPFNEARDVSSAAGYGAGGFTDYASSLGGGRPDEQYEYISSEAADGDVSYDPSLIEFIGGEDAVQGTLGLDVQAVFAPLSLSERYCAVASGGSVVVVDVPRAVEAVMFDRFLKMADAGELASQRLLFPQEIPMTMEECSLARQYRGDLESLGIVFTVADEHTVVVESVPADLTSDDPARMLRELLADAESCAGAPRQARMESLAAALARRASRGTPPRDAESLRAIVSALAECVRGNFTPSGQPVMLHITESEIKRRL